MQWQDFIAALALYFVLEGMLPFVSPTAFRRAMISMAQLNDTQLRIFGVCIMLFGLFILSIAR